MSDGEHKLTAGKEPFPGNIFLVGLMGAGKTSMGKLLARRLGKTFYDSDHEIERATGVKVAVIFEIEGEAGFRSREAKILAELVRRKDIVLATKFGLPMDEAGKLKGASRSYIMRAVEASLKRLRTDWIDLYQLHRPDPLTPIEKPCARSMTSSGKARSAGSAARILTRRRWLQRRRRRQVMD